MVFGDELLDWKPRDEIVPRGERGIRGSLEFDIRGEILDIVVEHVADTRFEPAVGDALVCVQKADNISRCVLYSRVSGCVRRLDVAFGEVSYSVVGVGVLLDELWCLVRRVVVNGEDFISSRVSIL